MKNLMSRAGLVCAIALCMTVACWAQTQTNTTRSGQSSAPTTDSAFLKRAMADSQFEIELGRLAETRSQNPKVKEFAQMMVTDHTQALNRLRDASGMSTSSSPGGGQTKDTTGSTSTTGNIMLSKEQQHTMNRLSKLSGHQFDKEYINEVVQEHRKDIRSFEMEAGVAPGTTSTTPDTSTDTSGVREKPGTTGNDAKSIARELLPTLKMHLQEAETIQRDLGLHK